MDDVLRFTTTTSNANDLPLTSEWNANWLKRTMLSALLGKSSPQPISK